MSHWTGPLADKTNVEKSPSGTSQAGGVNSLPSFCDAYVSVRRRVSRCTLSWITDVYPEHYKRRPSTFKLIFFFLSSDLNITNLKKKKRIVFMRALHNARLLFHGIHNVFRIAHRNEPGSRACTGHEKFARPIPVWIS